MLEITENAGATSLAAGHLMPAARVVELLQEFHINVLAGDGSQIIQVVHCISSVRTGRDRIRLEKIIYTSEALTPAQKSYIRDVLGGAVKICSILGSAEAGPYAASSPDLDPGDGDGDPAATYTDFVFDTRANLIEVFPLSASYSSADAGDDRDCPAPLGPGETGRIAQTSLARLRNPLVRYVTGDVGSLQPLPARAHASLPEGERAHLRVLRLHGRDAGSSFTWDGEYIELGRLEAAMRARADLGILQWQVLLGRMVPSNEISLEIRLLLCVRRVPEAEEREEGEGGDPAASGEEAVSAHIRGFFFLHAANEHRFRLNFVKDRAGFELSRTGRKVVKLVDRSSG